MSPRLLVSTWLSQEVTDAATESLFVVVYLYRDGRADCELVNDMLTEMAKRNPNTKFTRIYYSNAVSMIFNEPSTLMLLEDPQLP